MAAANCLNNNNALLFSTGGSQHFTDDVRKCGTMRKLKVFLFFWL